MLTAAFALECQEHDGKRRAAADERLRIARELHDAVAHSLDEIGVHADAAMQLIDADPAEVKRSLAHISRVSRSSRAELRRLLDVVDDEGATGV